MAKPERAETVLVTGGSGFIATHTIIQLLNAGYSTRTTVRSASRQDDVKKMLGEGGVTDFEQLSFSEADLLDDIGWAEAVKGCTYVLHMASPFPATSPKNEDDLIIPAREGTLRVLRAARDANVKRVVVTSSFAAIGYGHSEAIPTYTEEHWTDLSKPGVSPYAKSKTLAEKSAWNFIEKEGNGMELTVVNPTAVYGPVLGPDFASSVSFVHKMLNGEIPFCPNLMFGVVDVRDVAELHIKAMLHPEANGERFLCVSPPSMTVSEMSQSLRAGLGDRAKNVPTRTIPDFVLRLGGLFSRDLGHLASEVGKKKNMSNEKATKVLGWVPRSGSEALVATGESLFKYGLVKD